VLNAYLCSVNLKKNKNCQPNFKGKGEIPARRPPPPPHEILNNNLCLDKFNPFQIMWKRLYKSGSSKEGGTLLQLRNRINRRNVSDAQDITKHVNEIEDFLELVVNCHLIAAAMHFFSMATTSDEPHSNGFPSNIAEMEQHRRQKILFERLGRIVDEYIVPREFNSESSQPEPARTSATNPHLTRISTKHQYTALPTQQPRHRHLPTSVISAAPRSHASPAALSGSCSTSALH
jgi:hypothetical protein